MYEVGMAEIRHMIVSLLPRLRGFAHALARSTDAADDLVQATCEKALRSSDSWTPGTRLDSWMFRIMQNHWIDTVRKQRPETALDAGETPLQIVGDDGERITEARLTLATVQQLIGRLPEDQRAVLVLVCVEDLSYREAAETLGVPVGTVMSRLSRARTALAEAISNERAGRAAAGGRR
jgi:RNA polymerase sigma-70 factor (ECF subfamily)